MRSHNAEKRTMYLEFTDAPTPSDRAQRFTWEYFERDGTVLGRRVPRLAFGDCDSEISVRPDGFSFRWCDTQLSGGEPSLSYDPSDSKYHSRTASLANCGFRQTTDQGSRE